MQDTFGSAAIVWRSPLFKHSIDTSLLKVRLQMLYVFVQDIILDLFSGTVPFKNDS
jgi:hypothetical protein